MKKYKVFAVLAAAVLAAAAATVPSGAGGVAYGESAGRTKQELVSGEGINEKYTGPVEGVRDSEKHTGPGADAKHQIPGGPAVIDGVIQPQNLEAAKEADQLIVVVGTGGCNADAYYYSKDGDSWGLEWKEASIVGRGGITAEKAEGDGKTPAGTYGFTMAFGLKADPGSVLPYHTIVKGDYWVDDSASPYYNSLVNTSVTPKTWGSAENLAKASPYYNYALALDYNPDRVPGKGSAIFLHCFTASPDKGSAGCIRLPESRARELVQTATGKTRIVIAPDMNQLK